METTEAITTGGLPRRIAGRYQVRGVLGRGGMAIAYHVDDAVTGRELALKQLVVQGEDAQGAAALFEREFHTLAELSHPRIIEVYDYGVADDGPYYTMQLLDGGDLRQRTPLPWREACALAYDVCSSLALIHSRRLVHRDITPRNIRCTHDGQAKLIDFGAMAPMGPGGVIVGTPAFVAPEVVLGSALDARADLFSLGATLYYALTGRVAFPASNFAQLFDVWRSKPPAPSHLVEGIPGALDALIASLLAIEPAMRPPTAFEVMNRLSAVAGLERAEPPGVSRAYLTTPAMVGQGGVLAKLRVHMERAFKGRGHIVVIAGAPGSGRSRMLDAGALSAKVLGATVLRAGAKISGSGRLGVGSALVAQLMQALPDVVPSGSDTRESLLPQSGDPGALVRLILDVATSNPLLVAIDDVEHVDEASMRFLAMLASQGTRHQLLVAVTALAEHPKQGPLGTLASAGNTIALKPLTAAETEQLLASVFGDVPNLGLASRKIHAVSLGNPRTCMDLAQHLVDRGKVRYETGTWTLPPVLDTTDLPRSAEDAMRERIDALPPLARFLAESQALSSSAAFAREDYSQLCPDENSEHIDGALNALLSRQVLVSDGRLMTIAHAGCASALTAALSDDERRKRHAALVRLHERKPGLQLVQHLFEAGDPARALDGLGPVMAGGDPNGLRNLSDLDTTQVAEIFQRALDEALQLRRHPREITELRRWLASLGVSADHSFYWRAAPEWLAQLEQDSGLARFRELSSVEDQTERRSQALGFAYQKHAATPDSERVYAPDEAIKFLVHYVVISIAVGSRTHDGRLLRSLPPLLEPFVALSPVIDAMRENAISTVEGVCDGQIEQYLSRSLAVYHRLGELSRELLPAVDRIRHAIEFGVGVASASMGLASAEKWANLLDEEPMQRVNALYLRKAIHLQAGDWQSAEELRKKAELVSLESRTRQMFDTTLWLELSVHAMARDLIGLKQVMDRIELRAARLPGWVPYRHVGEGEFQYICGNMQLARAAFERAAALSAPDPDDDSRVVQAFPAAMAGLVASLIELGEFEKAAAEGNRALEICTAHGMVARAQPLVRTLALAEAKLGAHDEACKRLDALIAAQTELGVSGLLLGATYEARARIAIWASDEAAVERYARLTAQEYRHGLGSPLGARYERLMDEARRKVALTLPKLMDFGATHAAGGREAATMVMTHLFQGTETTRDRGRRILEVLCSGSASVAGYLYLLTDAGPLLIALQGAEEPEGLREHVSDCLMRDLRASDGETAIVSVEDARAVGSPAAFSDSAGRAYRAVFLTAMVDDVPRHAAVAILVDAADEHRPVDFVLTSALATYIIETGDTRGIAARDDSGSRLS
jgi:hypothetical protein